MFIFEEYKANATYQVSDLKLEMVDAKSGSPSTEYRGQISYVFLDVTESTFITRVSELHFYPQRNVSSPLPIYVPLLNNSV